MEKNLYVMELTVRTGLEPATSCVTGRHSNQLNYQTIGVLCGCALKGSAKITLTLFSPKYDQKFLMARPTINPELGQHQGA